MSFSFAPYPQNRHPPYNYAEPSFWSIGNRISKAWLMPLIHHIPNISVATAMTILLVGTNGESNWGYTQHCYMLWQFKHYLGQMGERGENSRDHKGSPLIYEDHRGATHTHINRQQGRLNIKRTKNSMTWGDASDVEMNGPVSLLLFF